MNNYFLRQRLITKRFSKVALPGEVQKDPRREEYDTIPTSSTEVWERFCKAWAKLGSHV